MKMEFATCKEASVPLEICRPTAVIATDCLPHCALQQANSAQSLAASSCSCSTSTCTDCSTSTCTDCSTRTCTDFSSSTSTCTDFSCSEGGSDEYPAEASFEGTAATAASPTSGASADTSMSMLSLTFSDKLSRSNQFSSMKATSALTLATEQQQQLQHQQQLQPPQPQQQQQHYQSLGPSYRPRHHQQQKQRRRSNAISAKSRSSYLAQYNEVKCAYFDGVLSGNIPVKQPGLANRFN